MPKLQVRPKIAYAYAAAVSDLCLLWLAGVTAAPTVAGAAARAVTAFAVSPMELIRVRVQGSAAPAGVSYTQQLMSTVRSIHAQGEVRRSYFMWAICSASWWHEL